MTPLMFQMAEGRPAAGLQMLRANPRAAATVHLDVGPVRTGSMDSPACCSLCGRRAGRSPRVRTEPRLHTVCRSYMLTQEEPPQEHGAPRGEAARHTLRSRRKPLARSWF